MKTRYEFNPEYAFGKSDLRFVTGVIDQIILAVVNQHILFEHGLLFIRSEACGETRICRLDISVAAINSDNENIINYFQVLTSISVPVLFQAYMIRL